MRQQKQNKTKKRTKTTPPQKTPNTPPQKKTTTTNKKTNQTKPSNQPNKKKTKKPNPQNPTWCLHLEAETKRMGYTWGQLERLAHDGDAWRALGGGLCYKGPKAMRTMRMTLFVCIRRPTFEQEICVQPTAGNCRGVR